MTVMPGLIDSHTHIFLQGEDPAEGGYDAQLLKYRLAYRAARATVSAKRALEQGFTTIRDVETEGAGYGDIGIKQAIDEGRIPGPRIFASTRAHLHHRRLQPGGIRAGDHGSEGRAAHRRPGRGAQGGARAARARRGLDQGLHDAPLVARQARQPRLAADADGRRAARDRRRSARLEAQGGLPRLQRRGTAPRARRRLRFDRARPRARRRRRSRRC